MIRQLLILCLIAGTWAAPFTLITGWWLVDWQWWVMFAGVLAHAWARQWWERKEKASDLRRMLRELDLRRPR